MMETKDFKPRVYVYEMDRDRNTDEPIPACDFDLQNLSSNEVVGVYELVEVRRTKVALGKV